MIKRLSDYHTEVLKSLFSEEVKTENLHIIKNKEDKLFNELRDAYGAETCNYYRAKLWKKVAEARKNGL